MNNRKDITNGNLTNIIIRLSIPMVIAFLLQTSFNIVDGIFVGRINAEALAAVSMSFPVVFLMIALGSGIGIATTSIISRRVGAKQFGRASNAAEHSILIALIMTIFFTVFGLLFGKQIFMFMGAEGSLLTLVDSYSDIIFIGSAFMFLAFIGNNIIRGEGNMKIPMYVMGGSAVLNIILDPIFIFVLGWGVEGAAYATVISRFVAFLIAYSHIFSKRFSLELKPRYFKYNPKLFREIVKIGLPSTISQVLTSLTIFILTVIITKFGIEAIASFGIIFRLEGIFFMPVLGLMTAMITIIGQNVGAKKIKRAYEAVKISSKISVIFGLVMGFLIFIFAKQLSALFNNNPEVIKIASQYFYINAFTFFLISLMMMRVGAFLGIGKAVHAMMINVLRLIILQIPLAYLGSLYFGMLGVWAGIAISTVIVGVSSVIWFRVEGLESKV